MSRLAQHLRLLWRRDGGATAVEFALVAPLFFAFLFGVMEFGRLGWVRFSLQFAAEQATRYAITHSSYTDAEITAYARGNVSAVDPSLVTVSTVTESSGGSNYVVVNVTFDFTFVASGLLPYGPIKLVGRSRVAT